MKRLVGVAKLEPGFDTQCVERLSATEMVIATSGRAGRSPGESVETGHRAEPRHV